MAFREKSALVMIVALGLAAAFYVSELLAAGILPGAFPDPSWSVFGKYIAIVVVLSIIGHIVAASTAPKEAEVPMDERDRLIEAKAGHQSGGFLGVGVLLALGHFLVTGDGNGMFHIAFLALVASSILEYALRIISYRRVV